MTIFSLAFGAIVLLLFVSAFFAGSETALTAASRARMLQLEKDGSRAARDVNRLLSNRERMIGALLLGNTFVNILISSLATTMLSARLGPRTVAVTTVLLTFIILVFAEVLPKTLAIARTDRFALAVAWLLRPTVGLLAPIVGAVQFVVWRVLALFGVRLEEKAAPVLAPHEDIRGTVELHHQEGTVEREHRDMIGGILDLPELKIGDVMIHRKNLVTVEADLRPAELFEAILAARHTRVPVWRETPDNIIGVLHLQDVMREFVRKGGKTDELNLLPLMMPPWFVPDTTTLEEQLRAFRERRSHFALVVDEYGALQGVITFADILDQIFGDIPDQYETPEPAAFRPNPDGSYTVDGTTPVRELNRDLDWNLPVEEATTIAGLVIHEARTIPEPGQRFAFYGYEFEVLRRQRNQITALRVIPPKHAHADAEPIN